MTKLIAFLLLTSCVSPAPATPTTIPFTEFHEVAMDIYRGSQPSTAGMDYLKSIGIKTIIDLNDVDSEYQAERAQAEQLGINLVYKPLNGFLEPSHNDMQTIELNLVSLANRPVFIHCEHGQDRTGLAVGLYRVHHDGWGRQGAHDEMVHYGFHPMLLGLDWYFWNE